MYNVYMEPSTESVQEQLNAQQHALTKIYQSVEQMRKYMMWSAIATLVTLVLPLIAAAVILPKFMNQYINGINGILG